MPLGMIAKTVCTLLAAIGFASIGGSAIAAEPAGAGTAANANSSLGSGIDLKYVDPAVRPQDDFYRAVNGKWLDTFEMPVDKARYGSFVQLWATQFGRGRVLAFTDSTIWSNFCFFDPGKSELWLGMCEWLNHSTPMIIPPCS